MEKRYYWNTLILSNIHIGKEEKYYFSRSFFNLESFNGGKHLKSLFLADGEYEVKI